MNAEEAKKASRKGYEKNMADIRSKASEYKDRDYTGAYLQIKSACDKCLYECLYEVINSGDEKFNSVDWERANVLKDTLVRLGYSATVERGSSGFVVLIQW